LSFALTVTSLFLSLLAIIYSFYSNSTFNDTISSLNKSSNKIQKNSKKLSSVSSDLEIKIEEFPLLFKALEDKVDMTNSYLTIQYEQNNSDFNIESDQKYPEGFIDSYLNNSSIIGIFALYAIYLAYSSQKKFQLKELLDAVEMIGSEYSIGYLISASSMGFFSRKNYSDNWKITGFNEELGVKIKAEVIKRAEKDKVEEENDFLFEQMKKIENFFE